MPTQKYFRPTQAQNVIGVSRATVYRWVKEGHLTIHRRGSMSFIETEEAKNFITGLGD